MDRSEKIIAIKEFLNDYINEVENSDSDYVKLTCAETVEMYKIILQIMNL